MPSPSLPGHDTMGYQALLLARKLQADFMRKIRRTGLSPAQTNVLAEIARAGPLSQREIAALLDIGNASVGETLEKLETSGHILRQRGVADRRTRQASLTPKGEQAVRVIADASQGQLDLLRGRLGDAMFGQLTALLNHANALIDANALDHVE